MKNSMYQIEESYIKIISEIEQAEGEITPEVEKALEINEKEREAKSIAYLSVISQKEGLIKDIDAEIKRLQALKKTTNNTIDRLKNTLLDAVKIFGSFDVGLTKFGTRKTTKLEVLDLEKIDRKFISVKTTESVDKKLVTQAIKNGETVDGAELVEGVNLKIN